MGASSTMSNTVVHMDAIDKAYYYYKVLMCIQTDPIKFNFNFNISIESWSFIYATEWTRSLRVV